MEKEIKKYGQISKNILTALGLTATVTSVIIFPGLAYVWDAIDKAVTERSQAKAAFYRLKQREIISVGRAGKKIKISLTPKGRRRLLSYKLMFSKSPRPGHWDGRWWVVMFDVPEARRNIRDLVRRRLASAGFVSIQKSVFVYPFPCRELITGLRDYYQLHGGELYIFQAKVLEGERNLKKTFGLDN
ncbi:MAG: hypothetical protein M1275_00050 [Patescibacteria group bacterium]|nr:hypothetical protein [Patescibacteria group bacterium]